MNYKNEIKGNLSTSLSAVLKTYTLISASPSPSFPYFVFLLNSLQNKFLHPLQNIRAFQVAQW